MELGFDILAILRLKTIEKIGVGLGILALIAGLYWYLWFNARQEAIAALENQLTELQSSIQSKEKMLAELPKLRAELEALKLKEAAAMRQLPSSKDIPTLLTDISRAGHDQGLEFNPFSPQPETPSQFYADVPVDITVVGTYHNLALFMERVALFSRIVKFGGFAIAGTPVNAQAIPKGQPPPASATMDLTMTARLSTFRFVDQQGGGKK